jgi:hypothetical protein
MCAEAGAVCVVISNTRAEVLETLLNQYTNLICVRPTFEFCCEAGFGVEGVQAVAAGGGGGGGGPPCKTSKAG